MTTDQTNEQGYTDVDVEITTIEMLIHLAEHTHKCNCEDMKKVMWFAWNCPVHGTILVPRF